MSIAKIIREDNGGLVYLFWKQEVAGSNPASRTKKSEREHDNGKSSFCFSFCFKCGNGGIWQTHLI